MDSILTTWKKRLGIAKISAFEKKSKQSLAFDKTTLSSEIENLNRKPIIIVGDHRLVPDQTMTWIKCLDPIIDNQTLCITDRFNQKQQKLITQYLKGTITLSEMSKAFEITKPFETAPEGGLLLALSFFKKKKVAIAFCKPQKTFEKETEHFYQTVSQSKAPLIIGWTGSLKTAPVWTNAYAKNKNLMCINVDTPWVWPKPPKQNWVRCESTWVYTKHDPFYALEMKRLWQDSTQQFVPVKKLKDYINTQIKHFSSEMKVSKPNQTFRLITPFDLKTLPTKSYLEKNPFIFQCFMRGESAVIPSEKTIVICRLDQASVAEEAMHYLRIGHLRQKEFGLWVSVWEEAWGRFASLCVDPTQKTPKIDQKDPWEQIHFLGYALGRKIYTRWQDQKYRKFLKAMFLKTTTDDQEAALFIEEFNQWMKKT